MSNNPLQAYFRSPAMYIKLPSQGKYYPDGAIDIPPNGELPVFPMTSMDEIAIRTPDGIFNGASLVSVIKSCIPAIKDPWQLNNVDLEAVVVAIRAASFDGTIEVTSKCPACNEDGKYGVDLMKLLAEKEFVDYDQALSIGNLKFQFRPLTYKETNETGLKNFEIQRTLIMIDEMSDDDEAKPLKMRETVEKLNDMMLDVVAQTIASVITPEVTVTDFVFIREFLKECDTKTNTTIKEHSLKLRQANDTKPLKITCVHCQNEYQQDLTLNFTDFFA
jgi:hypothetical protein